MTETGERGRPGITAAVLVGVFLTLVAVANPRGQFPLNDDWAYTRSAFALGTGHGLRVDEWSAPSLIGQAIYGGVLVKAFGSDFTVLRLSTVLLAASALWLLSRMFLSRGASPLLVAAAGVSWALNPLHFCLALTFMTEVPFLFLVVGAICLLHRHEVSGRGSLLVLAGLVLGYAFLVRQTALLFLVAAAAVPFLHSTPDGWQKRLRDALRVAVPGSLLIGLYYVWLNLGGGATPATRRKFDLLGQLTLEQLVGNTLGIFFYMSFLTLPFWIALIPRIVQLAARVKPPARFLVPAVWAVVALCGLAWFGIRYGGDPYLPGKAFHAQMPFLLNVLYDTGIGPVTLDPTYYGPPATPTYPASWLVVTWLTAAGSVLLGTFLTWSLMQPRIRSLRSKRLLLFALLAFTAVVAFEVVFSHLQEGGLFDRHLLTALLPLLLVLAEIARELPDPGVKSQWLVMPLALAAGLAMSAFSVAGTHDYLEWNRARWRLGHELLASGVDPLSLSGGFEFNAWHNYDAFRARGDVGNVYYWWYDRRDYLIAMSVPEGYEPIRGASFASWMHHTPVKLYSLRKR